MGLQPRMVMKTIILPDEIVRELEQISIRFGVPPEEIIKRGISEYLLEVRPESSPAFEAIGFGMWAGRTEMENPVEWVHKLREQQWNRS